MNNDFKTLATRELTDMVALARTSEESNMPILDWLENTYKALGWQARRFPIDDHGEPRANLLLTNSDTPSILFDVHTDTVPPGQLELWTETNMRPRDTKLNSGCIYGLGTSDTLGSGAVLNALAREGRLPEGTAIVFTADEEIGAIGATEFINDGGIPDSIDLVVVCEPTNNLVVKGEKGFVPFDLVAFNTVIQYADGSVDDDDVKVIMVVGQEAHSARPFQGKNALFEATHMDDVYDVADQVVLGLDCSGIRNKVPGLAVVSWADNSAVKDGGTHQELRLSPVLDFLTRFQGIAGDLDHVRDERFKPPQPTMNVGSVTTTGNDLVFACDLRPVPGCEFEDVLDQVLRAGKACFGDAAIRHPHAPLPPVWNELDSGFGKALGDLVDKHGKAAYTEAAVYGPAGYRTIIAGPGNLLVHRPNEQIEIAALETGGDLYEKIAKLVIGKRLTVNG